MRDRGNGNCKYRRLNRLKNEQWSERKLDIILYALYMYMLSTTGKSMKIKTIAYSLHLSNIKSCLIKTKNITYLSQGPQLVSTISSCYV